MAFKKSNKKIAVAANPVELFRSLPRREYPTEMPHQRAILEAYVAQSTDKSDVALQLPTGSGKTLVGLLIAEWRRRKFEERVVYLCPTRQLVHQTVKQADEKYGLDVLSFTGSKRNYLPVEVAQYRTGKQVAITTYSSLFNTNPFFDDADTIILDDAHAAENYIASMWSLEIDPKADPHKALHAALASTLKPHLSMLDHSRLTGNWKTASDAVWIDKLPTPILAEIKDELVAILEVHTAGTDLEYAWSLLKESFQACHIYIGSRSILIRPLLPPTWSHAAFEDAQHRIYMSATLGEGGDLERLTGRENIFRMPVPEGFELQGVGRRFFMFPGMSIPPDRCEELRLKLIKEAGRSVVLAPSQITCDSIADQVANKLGYVVFSATDIEESKTDFTEKDNAVAVMAGRYDGIDFPREECRLLCVDGLPRAMNLQERFMMSKMGAAILFNERIQTRVLQAVGRCTRALQDFSAVYITGAEIQDYLADKKRWPYFYPELQSELRFGVDQSIGASEDDFIENFKVFLENGAEWANLNDEIVSNSKSLERSSFPAMDELTDAVKSEVRYQKAMWHADYVQALAEAKNILGKLKSPKLQGYRALWHYLAGSAAFLAANAGEVQMSKAAREQFGKAKKATNMLPWLVRLARFEKEEPEEEGVDHDLSDQVERMEAFLCGLGTTHEGAFVELEKDILEGLADPHTFEQAHRKLGLLLGFDAGKEESDASPDPWWIGKVSCLVFEDHAGAKATSELGADKARQAAGHPKWMKENVPSVADLEIISVLVSPVQKAGKGALPHLKTVYLWPLDKFRQWATDALGIVRELRATLSGPGDMVWRAQANEKLEVNSLSMTKIKSNLKDSVASDILS